MITDKLNEKQMKVFDLVNKKTQSIFGGVLLDQTLIELVKEIDQVYGEQE